jgi:zinc transporter, ZIP family
MGVGTGASSNVLLGLIAGMTIFLGLPVARWKAASEAVRGSLVLGSAGVLLFLIIEVGNHAIEMVESTAKSGATEAALLQGAILVIGLFAGLVGLAWLEETRAKKRTEGASALDLATMIAIGIGLHNFAEGLAIGQSFSGGEANLGWILVIGFALHNATEGFGIAGPLVGQDISIGRLFALGLIGGGPTAIGSLIGGSFVHPNIELLFLAVAVGSLIYVTRELLHLRFKSLDSIAAMTALTVGLLLGIGSELVVEVASVRSAPALNANDHAQIGSTVIKFGSTQTTPSAITCARGQTVNLVNDTDRGLEFEPNGLFAREAFVAPHHQLDVQIIGPEGQYSLSPEGGGAGLAVVKVVAGKAEPTEDLIQVLAAITTMEGHANAAYDLHLRALRGESPHAALDIKRAGKHAHHPMHELLEDKSPRAIMVQDSLAKHSLLLPIKEDLDKFSHLAGREDSDPHTFLAAYKSLLDNVEASRKEIGGPIYNTPEFKSRVVLAVLEMAEGEYREAVEGGTIKVTEAATPGKDAYLEYQDTRGFLKAAKRILDTLPADDFRRDGRDALAKLLNVDFKSVDPIDPQKPIPFKEIEQLFEKIEGSLKAG